MVPEVCGTPQGRPSPSPLAADGTGLLFVLVVPLPPVVPVGQLGTGHQGAVSAGQFAGDLLLVGVAGRLSNGKSGDLKIRLNTLILWEEIVLTPSQQLYRLK